MISTGGCYKPNNNTVAIDIQQLNMIYYQLVSTETKEIPLNCSFQYKIEKILSAIRYLLILLTTNGTT
ncbi:hypothetical protein BpHYR1_015605 [Brachionus plicatilis]|uniref:Uncharacterized protein n=1 Tax=Brachionus plicatilis TaxID=10195 RepID=A0A3M7PRI9_BRAPC|nr:hypothetical protein BpHYR1_015605 [Brachionus plicatilis]